MSKPIRISVLIVFAGVIFAGGCSKQVTSTLRNHTKDALSVKLTTPDGTQELGMVGSGGSMRHKFEIENDDLPARCTYSAGIASSTSFSVTEESPDKVWFHISKEGRIVGPLTEDDTFIHQEKTSEIRMKSRGGTVVE